MLHAEVYSFTVIEAMAVRCYYQLAANEKQSNYAYGIPNKKRSIMNLFILLLMKL